MEQIIALDIRLTQVTLDGLAKSHNHVTPAKVEPLLLQGMTDMGKLDFLWVCHS